MTLYHWAKAKIQSVRQTDVITTASRPLIVVSVCLSAVVVGVCSCQRREIEQPNFEAEKYTMIYLKLAQYYVRYLIHILDILWLRKKNWAAHNIDFIQTKQRNKLYIRHFPIYSSLCNAVYNFRYV